jgi:hypothetical protein
MAMLRVIERIKVAMTQVEEKRCGAEQQNRQLKYPQFMILAQHQTKQAKRRSSLTKLYQLAA